MSTCTSSEQLLSKALLTHATVAPDAVALLAPDRPLLSDLVVGASAYVSQGSMSSTSIFRLPRCLRKPTATELSEEIAVIMEASEQTPLAGILAEMATLANEETQQMLVMKRTRTAA